ncbi:MAG: hypothetical protein EOM46_24525 [Gammaproteobacteria bacterium]|uniref:Uncharacterized protein n=1 Tax=Tolumonas osonensis TaxID=675874 RepID=A0A841GMR6_9GAMM|nr:hypothetical protein [Tolumonas osonensis]MBB6056050.1 hypothetical protein [Tolumonas osonensis]NCB60564.1 hypothetical protein [Gammaproteobacteria bacterium]
MLLNTYEQNGRLFNMNFIEEAGAGLAGYRGELVLVEGEVADAAGRRKPPVAVIEQTVMLAGSDKIQMMSGLVHELAELEHFFSGYAADVDTGVTPLFFVVNAAKEMKVTMNGVTADIIPLPAGLVWTELCDLLGLEKGDFKGQSAGEKIATVGEALKEFKSGYSEVTWSDAVQAVTAAKRETRGAL